MVRIRSLVGLLILVSSDAIAQDSSLPSTEQFQALLTTCAIGSKIEIDGALRGSLKDIYAGIKSQIEAKKFGVISSSDFLEKIPQSDRIKALELYYTCIDKIMKGKKEFGSNEVPELIELTDNLLTGGKPIRIKARTIVARNAEIRSFDTGKRAADGLQGRPGGNGNPGTNCGGDGIDGTDGDQGAPGAGFGSGTFAKTF